MAQIKNEAAYRAALKRVEQLEELVDDDNPTIGIIFCADKDESVVKYSVLSESEQIFASKYKTVLPTEEELTAELDRNRRFLEEKSEANK